MDFSEFVSEFKKNPCLSKAGMILFHNGIVRETSREGRKVIGLRVSVNESVLESVIDRYKKVPGIADIKVIINSERDLGIGDDVMYLAVAGDIRENVIKTLEACLDEIKKSVTSKTEFFK